MGSRPPFAPRATLVPAWSDRSPAPCACARPRPARPSHRQSAARRAAVLPAPRSRKRPRRPPHDGAARARMLRAATHGLNPCSRSGFVFIRSPGGRASCQTYRMEVEPANYARAADRRFRNRRCIRRAIAASSAFAAIHEGRTRAAAMLQPSARLRTVGASANGSRASRSALAHRPRRRSPLRPCRLLRHRRAHLRLPQRARHPARPRATRPKLPRIGAAPRPPPRTLSSD